MALKFTDITTRIGAASLGNPSNATIAFWARRPTPAPNYEIILRVGTSTGRTFAWAPSTWQRSGVAADNNFSVGAGEWAYIAVTKSGGSYAGYGFTDVSAETVTNWLVSAYLGGTTLNDIEFGDVATAYGTGYDDLEIAHVRVWNSVLTTAQMNTEKNSASAVISSGLLLAASLDSALTAQTGSDLTVVAGTGYTFTAEAPASVSSGASVAPLAGAYYAMLRN